MRQVPKYGIIGAGRVAQHFQRYFQLLNLPVQIWQRKQSHHDLVTLVNDSDRLLLLISDDAIDAFYSAHGALRDKTCIHFSGAKTSRPGLYAAHPLMSFSDQFYDLNTYQNIPFILDQSDIAFLELLPQLPNQSYVIKPELKDLYHAYCVMSQNFSTLLWSEFMNKLEIQFALPKQVALPILQQTFENLRTNDALALTGPLVRKDYEVVRRHVMALQQDKLAPVYQGFLAAFCPDINDE